LQKITHPLHARRPLIAHGLISLANINLQGYTIKDYPKTRSSVF